MVRFFPKFPNQPNEIVLTIYSISCYCFWLMRDWQVESVVNGKISVIPFQINNEDYQVSQEVA